MSDRPRNDFKKRGGELLPRELLERAAEPTLVPDEALLAILLKTGAPGVNVMEVRRAPGGVRLDEVRCVERLADA